MHISYPAVDTCKRSKHTADRGASHWSQLFTQAPLYGRQAGPELAIVKPTWLSLVISGFAQGLISSIL